MQYILQTQQPAVEAIVFWLGGTQGASSLRSTCKAAMNAIQAPHHFSDFDHYLLHCAEMGDVGGCYHAREIGATDFQSMLVRAAEAGMESTCRLAKEFGAAVENTSVNDEIFYCGNWVEVDEIIQIGAARGYENICRLAKEWGCINYDRMMFYGSKFGRINICKLAKEWGAKNVDEAMFQSVINGHDSIALAVIQWGATMPIEDLLYYGTICGRENICVLAKSLGARNYEQMFLNAYRHPHIRALASKWIAEK